MKEIIGKTSAEIFTNPVRLRHAEEDFKSVMEGIPVINREFEWLEPDTAQWHWMSTSTYPIYDEDNKSVGLVGITNNITHLKKTELQLRESEQFLRAILDGQPSPIAVLDDTGNIINVNGRWRGYSQRIALSGDVVHGIDANYLDLYRTSNKVTAADANAIVSGIQKVYGWEASSFSYEFAVVTDNKDVRDATWFSIQVNRFYQNKQMRLIVAHTDVSDSRRLQLELVDALDAERQLNLLKSQFVFMVSHDFRTPLAAIKTTTEILQRYDQELEPEQIAERLSRILSSVDYLDAMLDDIIFIGMAQSGQVGPVPQAVDLKRFCNQLVNEVELAYQSSGRILFEISGTPLQRILDEKLLHRVLMNLLTNAMKYSDAEKPVRFTVQADDRFVTFTVVDEGIGIPEADQGHLFETFHRADNVMGIKGTGLGLVIVHEIVQSCNGELSFESVVNKGTTFTVRLPDLTQL